MKITFEIDDRLIPSIEQWLSTQVRTKVDEVTQAQRLERVYADPEAFLTDAVHQAVHQIVQQYPPDFVREQIAAAKRIQEEIKAVARPKKVGAALRDV